jgi:hypothetical protein
MSKLKTMLLAVAAAGGLSATAAAMPLSDLVAQSGNLLEEARVVCDQWGRCYETRRHHRHHYDDGWSAHVAPRGFGYYHEPRYGIYGGGPGFSFGFGSHWR